MVFGWPGLKQRCMPQPHLDVDIGVDFVNGSFVAPNPWQRGVGRAAGHAVPVCRVSFGVSPLQDRIYVDGLWVDERFRRQGYASALLLTVADRMSPSGGRLTITALHEVWTSIDFWSALRRGAVSGLTVTTDLRAGDMGQEAQRWRCP
ncbi:MAG: hypothetical protein RLZZ618_2710 [Pseudomonadota bacterium]